MKTQWKMMVGAAIGLLAFAANGKGMDCDSGLRLQVQAGDTLGRLFGDDWAKVWRCNQTAFVRRGSVVRSPDLVASGQLLVVPPGARLTEQARTRIAEWRQRQQRIERDLDALSSDPEVAGIVAEFRRMLAAGSGFAGDLDFVESRIAHFRTRRERAGPPASVAVGQPWMIAAGLTVCLLVLVWRLFATRRDGDLQVREQQAWRRVKRISDQSGLGLHT